MKMEKASRFDLLALKVANNRLLGVAMKPPRVTIRVQPDGTVVITVEPPP